ncbi:hypothetical protein HJFPF1_04142 [Paramyrothecium foliicola]|nr:hypothetical protein HJFPF1_04142 [Paramyrothecium foliicola]
MKFSGLLSLAAAIVGATAAPALEERQEPFGIFLIQFFNQPNCQGSLQDSQVFTQYRNAGVCQAAEARVNSYPSWRVRQVTDITSPVTLFSQPGCTGESVTVAPDTPIFTCFTQTVGSGRI